MLKQSKILPKNFIQKNSYRIVVLFLALSFLLGLILLSITSGTVSIDFVKVMDILKYHIGFGEDVYWSKVEDMVVYDLRLPRALLACLAGAGLTVSGVAMQASVKNPLADPYILGVSAGASAGATAVIAADLLDITSEYSISLGAFGGAILAMFFLFILNKNNKDSVRLLLSGCVISILCSSVTSIIMFMAKDKEKISSVVFWLMGSVADANWTMIPIVAVVVVIGFFTMVIYYRQLNALLLGDETAHTLGVDINRVRKRLVVLVALMVGAIVAFCGMIGFVGFVIPHIVRSLLGANHKIVLPVSAYVGAIFLLLCDIVAKVIVAPEELPIGIVTALIGAPFFIYILGKNKNSFGSGK